MEIKELESKDLMRKYSITLTSKEVAQEMDNKAMEIGKTAKIDGFRQGKIPLAIIKARYQDTLKSEVLDKVVNSTITDLIKEKSFQVSSKPEVGSVEFEDQSGISFTVEFELLPEIPQVDYAKIKINQYVSEPSDKELNEAMSRIQKGQVSFEKLPDSTKAKKGHFALIDVVGSMDGKDFPEGRVVDKKLELGSGEFIPGFEDGLVGSKAGDQNTLDLNFPDDYWMNKYAGKPVSFVVTVRELFEGRLPTIDDEFAQKINFKDLNELQAVIKNSMASSVKDLANTIMKKDLLDQLDKQVDVPLLPSKLIKREGEFLSQENSSKDKAKKSNEELAKRRVKLGMILANVAKEAHIQVSQNDLKAELEKHLRASPEQGQQIIEYYRNNPHAVEALKGKVLEDKAIDFIMSKITLVEKKVTPEKLNELFKDIE